MRSTRRSARNNSTAVHAMASPTETAGASSGMLPTQTEAAQSASSSAVTAEFTESDYATPARPGAAEGAGTVTVTGNGAGAGAGDHYSAPEEMAITRNRGTRVPASASPARARSPKGEGSKAKAKSVVMASSSSSSVSATASEAVATSTSASSHLSLGATNTVTPLDSIKTIKTMDTPVAAVVIESAAAAAAAASNNNSTNDGDASDKQLRAGKQDEPDTFAASAITKEKEDSERNKTSAPDDSNATATAVESTGDSINSSNIGNNGGDNKSQRGLVSRRGRFISPGRRLHPVAAATAAPATVHSPPSRNMSSNNNNTGTDAVIEYKTYRSPSRKRDEEVPSLCSTGSGHLTGISTRSVAENEVKSAPAPKPPASSISCDPSMIDSTSPLASHEHADARKQPAIAKKPATTAASRSSQTPPRVTADTSKKSPAKSPPGSNFQTLPSLDDAKMLSPGGNFLAQSPPKASYRMLHAGGSFEEKKRDPDARDYDNMDAKPSPRRDRDRYVATPTDFALDYGKGHHVSGSFDTSNVLAWLQSPTANGFFSPGGYGSIMNTPHAPRTPRTPTVSTSFFFSDVASLPRGNDNLTPKGQGESASKRAQKGISNIICISPLASSKARSGTNTNTNTPVNLKDVFASPKERERNPRGVPMLNDTPSNPIRSRVPQRSGSKDPSLDAVHMAERDLMEDEDLSVLLQLASNTPRSASGNNTGSGMHVFRSPSGRKDNGGGENLPALQLPMIGGRDGDVGAARLPRKSHSRDHTTDADDFAPPQLGMRSNLSNGSKEIFVGGNNPKPGPKPIKHEPKKSDGDKHDNRGPMRPPSSNNPYPMPPPYPPHHGHGHGHDYYPMPPGMPPGPNGSMRVVVGGPPPPRVGSKPGSPARHPGPPNGSPHAPPPHYHGDPYSGMPYPPPPHGMYSQYPGPPHMQMGGYPYQSHYPPPPPRHMPMYGAQHPPGASKGPVKKMKPPKPPKSGSGIKRSAASPPMDATDGVPSAKKLKKTPSEKGTQKKKNKSPQLVDRAERQKAADTIAAVNQASGGKNDRAAALAAAILRGVTMRPSGKWQAQLYFAGKSRYIGVFDTREKAALAYEIAREKLKTGTPDVGTSGLNQKSTENLVNAARKAAFEGVNERAPK